MENLKYELNPVGFTTESTTSVKGGINVWNNDFPIRMTRSGCMDFEEKAQGDKEGSFRPTLKATP